MATFNPSGQQIVEPGTGKPQQVMALWMQNVTGSLGALNVQGPAEIADLSIPPVGSVALAVITDSDTVVWGDPIIGSGADTVLAWYLDPDWRVVGK